MSQTRQLHDFDKNSHTRRVFFRFDGLQGSQCPQNMLAFLPGAFCAKCLFFVQFLTVPE